MIEELRIVLKPTGHEIYLEKTQRLDIIVLVKSEAVVNARRNY